MSSAVDLFVISLEREKQRRSYMSAQLDRISHPYAFFPGVEGAKLDPEFERQWIDDTRSIAIYGKPLTPGEKGCALSHILLWQKVAQSGRNALIFEDDVILPKENIVELIAPILPELKRDRVVLLRHLANSFWWKEKILLQGARYCLRKPNHRILMAAAYLITPTAAQKLVDHLRNHKLAHPLDWWYRPDGLGFTKVVDTWATSPELVLSDYSFESLIDATAGDRDGLKALGALGWVRRFCFVLLRRVLFPAMRLVRSFAFKPIWPDSPSRS